MRRLKIEEKRLKCDLSLRFQDGKWVYRESTIGEKVDGN